MATWKRLTAADGSKADINMETVAYIARYGDTTGVVFVGGKSDSGSVLGYAVKETPDQIHAMKPLKAVG